ncbi:cytochrome C oxidase subunit I [Thermaerobacter sp. PB12/4term]|uniref:cbb3-type cytochrome c oxidase subunit I n=1 Tax=Thermaerobacter sp. PB12/4term TaxID=2293838 RepID=UPI000E3278A2|nr:cbb3-type cytochrome c oxidase subunit I [Thermaerobacter sp. PB12/4term]QIA27528.1 cytochrome C oxidase subunit I [Thermaerobacter sp. PB12/4term]
MASSSVVATRTPAPAGPAADFRTCPVTGLAVHRPAETLIITNAVTAVVFLAFGGLLALLIGLTRWPAVHLLPAELFYRFVTAHGTTMLVFWILFFEVAGLYFGSAVLLNARLVTPRAGWIAYALMLAGALVTEAAMLTGEANVMVTAYPPLKGHPAFYLGLIVFTVGALVAVGVFFATVLRARAEGLVKTSLPLVTYAFLAAAVLAVFTLVSGALALIPTFLWSMGWLPSVDPAVYRLLFWGFGHGSQQVNLAAMVGVWYALASLTVGARPLHEGLSRLAFFLYVAFIQLGSIHHLLVDPGLGTSNRIMNTSYFMYLATVGSMIHAFSIPSAVEVAQRERGHHRGLFTWLRKAPWSEPGFAALALSLLWFGFVGGVTGVIMGQMQLNMLVHNTLFVPGHFHSTVVAGTTVAFMGIAYYLLPLIGQRPLAFPGLARWQPYIYSLGLAVLTGSMMAAGKLGVPRRLWDITYQQAAIPVTVFEDPRVQLLLAGVGIGAVVAVLGGAMFVAVMLGTLFSHRTTTRVGAGLRIALPPATPPVTTPPITGGSDPEEPGSEQGRKAQGPAASMGPAGQAAGAGRAAALQPGDPGARAEAPGTVVLVFAFLAWFVLMYVVAWSNLHKAWPVG